MNNICNSVSKYGGSRKDRETGREIIVGRKKIKKCFLEREAEIALEVEKHGYSWAIVPRRCIPGRRMSEALKEDKTGPRCSGHRRGDESGGASLVDQWLRLCFHCRAWVQSWSGRSACACEVQPAEKKVNKMNWKES